MTKFWMRGKLSFSCRKDGMPRATSAMASAPTSRAGAPMVSSRDGAARRLRRSGGR